MKRPCPPSLRAVYDHMVAAGRLADLVTLRGEDLDRRLQAEARASGRPIGELRELVAWLRQAPAKGQVLSDLGVGQEGDVRALLALALHLADEALLALEGSAAAEERGMPQRVALLRAAYNEAVCLRRDIS